MNISFSSNLSRTSKYAAGDKKDDRGLPWKVRFNIAVGVAEAIHYLHNEISQSVIHRDIKSSNILLTDDFEPKVC